jgi:hypothetical protein
MLNHFAAIIACGRRKGTPDARALSTFVSISKTRRHSRYQPVKSVPAAALVENLLNMDYTEYRCCRAAAGYVMPSPGATFEGSLTLRREGR